MDGCLFELVETFLYGDRVRRALRFLFLDLPMVVLRLLCRGREPSRRFQVIGTLVI